MTRKQSHAEKKQPNTNISLQVPKNLDVIYS